MTIYSRVLGVALAGMTAVGALAVITGNAQANPPAEPSGGRAASFHGGSIDLTNGWGEAQSCVVFGPSDTRCYGTHAEADTVLGYSRATDPLVNDAARQGLDPAVIPACASGWLCLFEHTNGRGRRLIFNDEYFHWLDDWGFSRKTSSWRNNQGSRDGGTLRSPVYGDYNCSPNTYASQMGEYNDKAELVHG